MKKRPPQHVLRIVEIKMMSSHNSIRYNWPRLEQQKYYTKLIVSYMSIVTI